MVERLLLRVSEAAEIAGISRSLAYELIRRGEWPSIKVGKSVRVPAEALRLWVLTHSVESDEIGKLRIARR